MKKRSRYRAHLPLPQFDYEVASIGEGRQHHAVTLERALCGIAVWNRALRYSEGAVTCLRCRQRLAAAPHLYARPITTPPPPSVAEENLRVIVMLLEELSGSTTLLAEPTLEELATQIAALEPLLSNHAIVISVIPRFSAAAPMLDSDKTDTRL